MKNIKTKLDIAIENSVNKIYGLDKLSDVERIKKEHEIRSKYIRSLKEDNAKARLSKFLKTETGEKFINKLDIIALKPLCTQFNLNYLLLWKNMNAVRATIDEVMSSINVSKPDKVNLPKDYGTWKRDMFHALPKNLTTKKTVKTIEYNFYGQDPSLPFWKRVSTTKKIVPSEVGMFNEKYTNLRFKDEDERTDALVEYKFKKWQKRNPKPDTAGDLFPDSINQAWAQREIAARKSIRMMIENNRKRKLELVIRTKVNDDLYVEEQPIFIPFKRSIADKINETNTSPTYNYEDYQLMFLKNKANAKAQHIVNQIKTNGKNVVCGWLCNRDLNIGRCVLPAA